MTEVPRFLVAVLWAAIEDFHGLWEYPDEVRGVLPEGDSEEGKADLIGRSLVASCLADELVDLYWCQEPYGDLQRIFKLDGYKVLQNEQYWRVPADGDRAVRVRATDLGEEVYQRMWVPSGKPKIIEPRYIPPGYPEITEPAD